MLCERCSGLMVLERIGNDYETLNCMVTAVRRCLNCGNRFDAMILANRAIARAQTEGEMRALHQSRPRAVQPVRLDQVTPVQAERTDATEADRIPDRRSRPPADALSTPKDSCQAAQATWHGPSVAPPLYSIDEELNGS